MSFPSKLLEQSCELSCTMPRNGVKIFPDFQSNGVVENSGIRIKRLWGRYPSRPKPLADAPPASASFPPPLTQFRPWPVFCRNSNANQVMNQKSNVSGTFLWFQILRNISPVGLMCSVGSC